MPSTTPDATDPEIAAKKEAEEAKAKLQLFKITSDRKILVARPDQAFSLEPGTHHFEGPLPDAVVARFLPLHKAGTIKVEVLDGDGNVTPWEPKAAAT